MHNKPDMSPLDSRTKSGRLIDRIIKQLPKDVEVLKTNLYDIDYYPEQKEKLSLAADFHKRFTTSSSDIIVLLGGEVQKNYISCSLDVIVKIPHPAFIFSNEKQDEYVLNAVEKINQTIQKSCVQ